MHFAGDSDADWYKLPTSEAHKIKIIKEAKTLDDKKKLAAQDEQSGNTEQFDI
jgi:hypothetical protein